MKKLLVLLLTLVLSLSAFSLFGCNGDGDSDGPGEGGSGVEIAGTEGLTYSVLNDVSGNKYATFTGVSSSCTEKDIVIASHYQGYKVTEIGGLMGTLSGVKNIESIKVHKYVNLIASSAFIKAENLKTITFDEECELAKIGSSAFKNLKKFENFNYYGNLNSMGESVFDGCDAMKKTDYVGATYIGNDVNPYLILFKGLNEETVKVHKDCQAIYARAFYSQEKVKTVTFEATNVLKSIGQEAFSTTSEIIESIDKYEDTITKEGVKITSIDIPASVVSIGDRAFKYCEELVTVNFAENNSCTTIGAQAFECSKKLETVTNYGKTKILEISNDCFRTCLSLKGVEVPNTVLVIKTKAFWNCPNVATIEFMEDSICTEIQYHAFRGCKKTKQVIIPKSVQAIGYDVFAYCGNLGKDFAIYSEATHANDNYHKRWNDYNASIKQPTYFYSATSKSGCWRYVNGKPTLW